MSLPTLEITNFPTDLRTNNLPNLEELACSICRALSVYPHFVIVNGYPPIKDRSNLVNLSKAIYAIGSGKSVFENRIRVSFTEVHIDLTKATEKKKLLNIAELTCL
ncbi:MAG: hypothetical protein AB4206_17500 [Xenococcaceae cyanobacterium]